MSEMSDPIRDGALIDHGDLLFHSMSAKLRHYYNGEVDGMGIVIDEPACSIYRVPPSTCNVDPSAYEPEVVSIGPYHRQNPKLHAMEDHKWRYMHNLLRRRRSGTADELSDSADEVLKRCIDKVRRSEARARRCYKVPNFCSMISNYDFVTALVLDGCFILEMFLTYFYNDAAADDPIYAIPWMFPAIWRDLIKLENQVPFFILQDLFAAINNINSLTSSSLEKLAFNYLQCAGPLTLVDPFKLIQVHDQLEASKSHLMINIGGGNKIIYDHLLHLYHVLLRPSTSSTTCTSSANLVIMRPHSRRRSDNMMIRCVDAISKMFEKVKNAVIMPHSRSDSMIIPCVVELCDAGITVSWRKPEEEEEAACALVLLDVTFKDGVLHVPRLSVEDNTNTAFRNLLALEQFCPGNSLHVSSYITFLNCIVNTAKDVTILQQRGIIDNMLGSEEEVALLINRLGKDVTVSPDSDYLKGVFTEVNDYCEFKWHKHRASWERDYFGSPWSVISLVAAFALLVMTLIQVVYAILSYKKQKHEFDSVAAAAAPPG